MGGVAQRGRGCGEGRGARRGNGRERGEGASEGGGEGGRGLKYSPSLSELEPMATGKERHQNV